MMTDDEIKIAAIEARATHKDGSVIMSEKDFKLLLASRLAWKYTAKCFAATEYVDKSFAETDTQ